MAEASTVRSTSSFEVSAGSNRTFSRSATSPSASPATVAAADWPTRSVASATGRSDGPPSARSAKSSPLGRPRCAITTTRAPRSASLRITGSEARMRPSSVITPLPDLSNGTFRSDLTSTRRPLTSRSSMFCMSLLWLSISARRSAEPGGDEGGQVDEAVGVPELVVVPAEDLDLVPVGHRDRRVEGAGGGRPDDVGGDDRVLGVDQDALERALGRGLVGGVDLVLGDVAAQLDDQVGDRPGDHRDAQRVAVELALELGDDQAGRLGGAGGGRHDVLRGGAGAT